MGFSTSCSQSIHVKLYSVWLPRYVEGSTYQGPGLWVFYDDDGMPGERSRFSTMSTLGC